MHSYIEDTPDLLRFLERLNENGNLPPGSKPFSIDIKSMYSNVPIEKGIKTFEEALEKRSDSDKKRIPTHFVVQLLKLVLKSNTFEFNNELWIQVIGVAMGTRVAPTFANLLWKT